MKIGSIVHSHDGRDDREVFYVVLDTNIEHRAGLCHKIAPCGDEEHPVYRHVRLVVDASDEIEALVSEVLAAQNKARKRNPR